MKSTVGSLLQYIQVTRISNNDHLLLIYKNANPGLHSLHDPFDKVQVHSRIYCMHAF